MKILSIDSTSSTARLALTENNKVTHEYTHPVGKNDWDDMVAGDTNFLIEAHLNLVRDFMGGYNNDWSMIDYICYSGFSGFKSAMNIGKIIANTLGLIHNKQIVAVDHITAHYFSLYINKEKGLGSFPKLVYSASGSHNSIVYMKDEKTLSILNDDTYFDQIEKKFIGLGSIYNRLLRNLDILKETDAPQDIPKVLGQLRPKVDEALVSLFKSLYIGNNIFDLDMFQLYNNAKEIMKNKKGIYSNVTMFFSFEQALFEILGEKFDSILDVMPVKEIAIVGGVSQNDNFIKFLTEKYNDKILVSRPASEYRFDNAAMLGVLLYYMKKNDTQYPFSEIIT